MSPAASPPTIAMIRLRNLLLPLLLLVCLLIYLLYTNTLNGRLVQVDLLKNFSTSVKDRLRHRTKQDKPLDFPISLWRPSEQPANTTFPSDQLFPTEDADDPKFKVPPADLFKENGDAANSEKDVSSLKKILFWNDDYHNKHFGFGFGHAPFVRAGCRVDGCLTTGERGRFLPEELDAVVWHFRSDDKSLPGRRSPHTRYVFWLLESPPHLYGDISRFDSIFNWTMTYRLDSEFPNAYGQVYRRKNPLHIPSTRNYAEGKTKMAAWFVSHCHTVGGRESLAESLQQWIDVDVFGSCGSHSCERSHQSDCDRILNEAYKFYLSFENSLCRDYVTEKFFNILKLDVVPVVYGLGNYSVQAPPHSYIDALSFPTAKDLADYLLYLDRNHTAYNEYFRWKTDYFVSQAWFQRAQAYCALCERLHTDNGTKVYDLSKWFVQESHCLKKTTPEIQAFIGGHRYHPALAFLACLLILLAIALVFLLTVTLAEYYRPNRTYCKIYNMVKG
ncbi:alpha-(1,3)-fucosyltransferase C-like isoform X1 [Penaeus chinensis]|uniref:alpha-(1,3)-fucosyltransferase C-like isoform X1 n=1 Tax=Penaeus chinensis TaxID=139456 RepID=UPI001FB837AB|nr:alpha-(1,3)-fucosyltransferase C-like isoform X1 [Penaeus chinensis]XP_047470886.1 alpha-(1,3)-fucosyltransferase C-like isoform X1 [Penaeus chinensis]